MVVSSLNEWMSEWKCSDLKFIQKPTSSQLSLTHLPVQPLSRVKSLDGPRVCVISPVVKEKVYEAVIDLRPWITFTETDVNIWFGREFKSVSEVEVLTQNETC